MSDDSSLSDVVALDDGEWRLPAFINTLLQTCFDLDLVDLWVRDILEQYDGTKMKLNKCLKM